jgi:DNA-binding LacI/PurR family transcriptional regulator
VDNFENYDHELKRPPFFTAIDRCFKECFIQGAELLFKQINQSSANRIIVQVPTRLVIRKSVRNIAIKDKEE